MEAPELIEKEWNLKPSMITNHYEKRSYDPLFRSNHSARIL